MSKEELCKEDQEATDFPVNLCSLKHTICYFNQDQNQNQNTLLIPQGDIVFVPDAPGRVEIEI